MPYANRLTLAIGPYIAAIALVSSVAAVRAEIPTASAAALYQRNCAACHGEKGDGQSRARNSLSKPPRDFTASQARRELPRQYMVAIVRDGKHEAPMVGRKTRLTQEQIEAVIDFIRTAFMPPAPGTPLARGREIYTKMCASCHGDRGQGGAAGHSKETLPALSRTQARSGLTRERMIAATADDKHRAARANALSASDIEAVVDYVRATFIEGTRDTRSAAAYDAKPN